MKKLLFATIVSLSTIVTNIALAAPNSTAPAGRPCSHCVVNGTMRVEVAGTRGASLSKGDRPCKRNDTATARWGSPQQPCSHCSHSA
jgi:hypothetical protein